MPCRLATRSLLLASFCFLIGCGSTLGKPDGGGGGGAGGDTGRACLGDTDCQITFAVRPVGSVADCYCTTCDVVALNSAAAQSRDTQWNAICSAWSSAHNCPIYDCIAPPPVRCFGGLCTAGSQTPPSTCPQEAASGCADGGVMCGGACCKAGEWCDQAIGACRCGYVDGCSGDLICATAGASTLDSCGFTCCGGSSGLVCPR